MRYRLYANDISVRTNHVDATHAYWNGAATYLALEEAPNAGARVVVHVPDDWQIATALDEDAPSAPPAHPSAVLAPVVSTGVPYRGRAFRAKTFDELCDAPFECSKLILRSFTALGKTHRLAAWDTPDARTIDWDKVAADTKTIVEAEAMPFGRPAPGRTSTPLRPLSFHLARDAARPRRARAPRLDHADPPGRALFRRAAATSTSCR